MIETLTMAVIVLATILVGLALMFGALLSDHNRRINKIRKGFISKMQEDIRLIDNKQRELDPEGIGRAINDLSGKVEKHEKTFKTLSSARRVARWRSFNEFNIMHEGESPRCGHCLSDDTEYDTEYADIAGSKAPDKLVSQCCKCGQKSTLWRFDSEC